MAPVDSFFYCLNKGLLRVFPLPLWPLLKNRKYSIRLKIYFLGLTLDPETQDSLTCHIKDCPLQDISDCSCAETDNFFTQTNKCEVFCFKIPDSKIPVLIPSHKVAFLTNISLSSDTQVQLKHTPSLGQL